LGLWKCHSDQPLSLYSYYFLSELTRKAKSYDNVLLTGDGADEVFFGYSDFVRWTANGRNNKSLAGCNFSFNLSEYGIYQGSESLVGHGFVKVDKATSENQMEARCPFLDQELVYFVRAIPKSFWIGKEVKFLLKRYLLRAGFESSYVFRKKIGFAYPFRYAMVKNYRRIRDYIRDNEETLSLLGINNESMTYTDIFRNFDTYWKCYILLKYLNNNTLNEQTLILN